MAASTSILLNYSLCVTHYMGKTDIEDELLPKPLFNANTRMGQPHSSVSPAVAARVTGPFRRHKSFRHFSVGKAPAGRYNPPETLGRRSGGRRRAGLRSGRSAERQRDVSDVPAGTCQQGKSML